MDIKIFVVTHKDVENLPSDRTVIGVGGNRNLKCADVFDNTGDNIESKNSSFCELTALYWIWKNDNTPVVGLEHYRRFFSNGNIFRAKPLDSGQLLKKLKGCDIIVPKKSNLKMTVYARYKRGHVIEDMDICREIIKTDYPEYEADFDFIMNERKIFMTNMFVANKEIIDGYCEWLFHILFEAEKRVNLAGRNDYQSRAFGFLSERLFNVWVHHHNLKVRYLPVRNIGDCLVKMKFNSAMKKIFKRK